MNSSSLKRLLLSAKNNIKSNNLKIECVIFTNSKNYVKPMNSIFGVEIEYLSLEKSKSLNIASARTYLQQYVYLKCKKNDIKPIVWILDEDKIIDKRANNYLPKLDEYKKYYDVLIGSIEGDSPNSVFSGINVQLSDLIFNLTYLNSLDDDSIFPSNNKHNKYLRKKYFDYYYDLSSKHTGHLNENFYIEPLNKKEKVVDVRNRILSNLEDIISGKNIFRPIVQETITEPYDTICRGGNTFILNLDTLNIENPNIDVGTYKTRRSDMLWALINKEFMRKKIVKTDFVVLHNRKLNIKEELNIQKIVEENTGSIIINALKKYYDEKNISFQNILNETIEKKRERVFNNFKLLKNNIQLLEKFENSKLDDFIGKIKSFYNDNNSKLIINHIDTLTTKSDTIFEQFNQYKPLILDRCTLKTLEGDLLQYDIGNDNIKIITKTPIEQLDKNSIVIRIHSSCTNSEVFGAIDCDCANQLEEYKRLLLKIDNGILFYINQEGRGHGYGMKISIVRNMQSKKVDTYEACQIMGLKDDIREYKEVAYILKKLGINTVNIATNNPKKLQDLQKYGITVKRIKKKLVTHYTHNSIEYLISKQDKANHKDLIIDETYLFEKYPDKEDKIFFYEKYDEYGGFSNFSNHMFSLEGKSWRTSEHYYQAQKFKRDSLEYRTVQYAKTANEAKVIAHSYKYHYQDWNKKRIYFMHNGLIEKFRQNLNLQQDLLNTKESYIVENANDDDYWGVGKNILGRLLMYVRDELRD
jgi:GTP cyclohydrolase II